MFQPSFWAQILHSSCCQHGSPTCKSTSGFVEWIPWKLHVIRIHLAFGPQNWVRITTFCKVVNVFGKCMCKPETSTEIVIKRLQFQKSGARKSWLRKRSFCQGSTLAFENIFAQICSYGNYCPYSYQAIKNLKTYSNLHLFFCEKFNAREITKLIWKTFQNE